MIDGDVIAKHKNLRDLNLKAYTEIEDSSSAKLDSSLKRHTAFLKRIKLGLGAENAAANIKDIQQLSLSKHVEEIVANIPEGVLKCKSEKDIWAAVEIISALHQRFPQSFTTPLSTLLSTALNPPNKAQLAQSTPEQKEKDEIARVNRQRPILRVTGELYLVGVLLDPPVKKSTKETDSARPPDGWLFIKLKELLATDKDHANIPILISFIKYFGNLIYGHGGPELRFVDGHTQDRFRSLSAAYYETVSRKLVKEHLKLQEQDKRNHEAYIKSGEIFEDRQQNYEKLTKVYEKLLNSTQTLSELLHIAMPELPKEQSKGLGGLVVADGSTAFNRETEEYDSTIGKWEDEESKNFYEDVLDLADIVPPSVLASVNAKTSEQNEQTADVTETQKQAEVEEQQQKEEIVNTINTSNDEPEEGMSAGPAAQLNALFAKLPEMNNRAMIDQVAVEFAMFNSKAARKRAAKSIASVPRNRSDVLPYYARLTAILSKHMPDIGKGVVDLLDDEFRYLQRKKNLVKELAESRTKNARFISELTKFAVVPTHYILHCYKVLLDDFTGVNVDVLAIFLETCGRYLLRSEETSEKMKIFLDLMKRKQQLQHLDQRQQLLLENAYYQCNPPERAARPEKYRSPIELFIRHLIYDVLARKSIDKVSKLLRKLHWEDPDVIRVLLNVFTKVWKIRFSSISLLAILVYDLQRFHPEFCVMVVDKVLDDIKTGVEQNIFKYNQRRVSSIKYLGELYNYRSVHSNQIFDTLWTLVTFGHPGGRPLPGLFTPLDVSTDFFRVRLVCTLLDTCGTCFDQGNQKKRLDYFLTFFQMYVTTKVSLPMDIDFMYTDTLEALRPNMKISRTFEEAVTAVDEMISMDSEINQADDIYEGVYDDDESDNEENGIREGAAPIEQAEDEIEGVVDGDDREAEVEEDSDSDSELDVRKI
ncbi:ARM repeat-containing protein [Wallemia mellicola]|uniref:ARM repeat-containing protein n=1 Tax=Wallemia mellicola TaxID=1708541 RepID=A0A4T0R7W9_9BASI|nr:ARM repeat-containing protein [Wallemia mellicola]TIC33018.1 ARM repeat-containing protein [Wallemia mellicola]